MLSILNSKESKDLDLYTIKNNITSKNKLIDNAGKSVAYHIIENIKDPFNKSFLCIAGTGDNGLDAIVCNFYLNKNNVDSTLMIIDSTQIDGSYLEGHSFVTPSNNIKLSTFNYIVDGVFGAGLNRNIKGDYYSIVSAMNKHGNIISIDIPSGIYADSGNRSNISINSRHTVTFGYPKIGHYISKGYKSRGHLYIYPIGHPLQKNKYKVGLIEKKDISNLLKPLSLESDKYGKGKILSLAGSINYTGAALLSSLAAMRAGAGILKNIYPYSLKDIFSQFKEIIDYPLPDKNGFLTENHFKEIKSLYKWPDCFIIGPGLSSKQESTNLVKKVLSTYKGKSIIDATALSAINFNEDKFTKIPKKSILTPHYNELSKMLQISREELNEDTMNILSHISIYLEGRILILKGSNIIIVNGDNEKYIIEEGTSLLATAGTGDILTGIIASYVANGYKLIDASIIGSYIHSFISSSCFKKRTENIIASDLINQIPIAQSSLR